MSKSKLAPFSVIVLVGLSTFSSLALAGPPAVADHGSPFVSGGVYRIPYANDVEVTVWNDQHAHSPLDRIDLTGDQPDQEIVAAASGWIRGIVDKHGNDNGNGDGLDKNGAPHDDSLEHSCQDDSTIVGKCQDYNNYVWIEHPIGEWTKYSHLATGSVAARGWSVGDFVGSGEVLGVESDVGLAPFDHLHFQVSIPDDPSDPTPFSEDGGFIVGSDYPPTICDIPDNLFAGGDELTAGPCTNQLPVADAGGPYEVDEGTTLQLTGAGSFDPDGTWLQYRWNPTFLIDDPTLAQPTFVATDDTLPLPFLLTVYDTVEAMWDMDSTTVTVNNVAPTLAAAIVDDTISEGEEAQLIASIWDPGLLDTHTAVIDWGDGGPNEVVNGKLLIAPGITHAYGDDGTYSIEVTIYDDDNGTDSEELTVSVSNTEPSLELVTEDPISFPSGDFLVARVGEPFPLEAMGQDPGSDDLSFAWVPGPKHIYYNDGSAADQPLSPLGTYPFAAEGALNVFFEVPGLQSAGVTLSDDDSASVADVRDVVVTGAASDTEGLQWWRDQFKNVGAPQLEDAILSGYLEVVIVTSSVFAAADLQTDGLVAAALSPVRSDYRGRATSRLLVAWLEFANGGVEPGYLVPTKSGDIEYLTLMHQSELAILDPMATDRQLYAVEQDLIAVELAKAP